MKRIFKSMWAVAVAAMTFTSCSENDASNDVTEVEKVTINITAGSEAEAESRTHLDGTAQVKWDAEGEALQVIENAGKMADAATTSATVSEDGLTAKFTVKLPVNTTASSYDYYAIYPAANFISSSNNALNHFKMELPKDQAPVADSFDPKADLLVSKMVTTTTQATDLNFQFYRPITVVQLQLMGIAKDEKISQVVFENSAQALAGRLYYDWSANTVTEYGYQGQDFKVITMACNQTATGTDDVYFTSFPAELTDFTVTVSTDKATYTKTVKEIPAGKLSFKAGHKAKVRVSGMTREEKVLDTYTLLTADNIGTLAEGYKLIITNGKEGSVAAMGAKQATENRMDMSAAITVETLKGATVINTIPSDAQVLTLEGDAKNGFLLGSEFGYLSVNGSANELKHIKAAKDASKWDISVAKNGNTDIICGTRPIRFNNTFFASYKGTSSCSPVYAFFKEGTPKTALATPTNLKVTVADGTNVAKLTWDVVANADSYTVTCGDNVQTVTVNNATIENLPWDSASKIEVVANPKEGDETYKSSAAAIATAIVGVNPNAGNGTIKELRSLMKDINYNVTNYSGGVVDAYVSAVFGNKVAVVDNTGEVGSGLVLWQAKLPSGGVKEGQKITLDLSAAKRGEYKGLLQLQNAKVTIKNATPTEIKKPTITATQLNTGNYQGMYVRINATTPATDGTWGALSSMKDAAGVSFNIHADNAINAVKYSANKTALLGGVADCYNNNEQLAPQTEEDVKNFVDTTPAISFTSTNLTVASTETSAKFAFTRNDFAATSNVTATKNAEASWVTSLNVVGNEVQCGFSANETTAERTATITVNLDGKFAATLTLKQAAKGSVTKTVISLDFSTDLPSEFPTSYVKTRTKYNLKGYDFYIYGGNGFKKQGNDAILFGKKGAYIEFPAIAGKKLTKVVGKPASGASAKVSLNITDTNDVELDKSLNKVWKDKKTTYTYDVSAKTAINTAYRLEVTNSNNSQIVSLELTYE